MRIRIQNSDPKVISIVLWVIWFMMTAGAVMFQLVIPKTGSAIGLDLPYLPLVPLVIGTLLRWGVLARTRNPQVAGSMFIAGMALPYVCLLLAILFMPEWRNGYFVLALLGCIQFAPFWSRRMQ